MKLSLLATIVALTSGVLAQTPEPPRDPFIKGAPPEKPTTTEQSAQPIYNLLLVTETFVVKRDDYLKMIEEVSDQHERYSKIIEWFRSGKARLETLAALRTKSGNRCVSEAIDEERFASEFNPPADDKNLPFPTSFEVRNVGDTLEVEATLDVSGSFVDTQIAVQKVFLKGYSEFPAQPGVGASTAAQPIFSTRKIITNLSSRINQPTLFGVLNQDAPMEEPLRICYGTFKREEVPANTFKRESSSAAELHFDYSFYSLSRSDARELLINEPGANIYPALKALVAKQKAKAESFATIVTKSGMRTITEGNDEERFPTEFIPPTTIAPAMSTSFTTRWVGLTIEIEPVLAPGVGVIDFMHAPQFVSRRELQPIQGVRAKYPIQPQFEVRKLSSHSTVALDQTGLIGTFNNPDHSNVNGRTDSGKVWLGFVKATVPAN